VLFVEATELIPSIHVVALVSQVVQQFIRKNHGHPIEQLLPLIGGNVGFVFTNGDLGKVREIIER